MYIVILGGNIFTDHKLSFAYLAMIENIANDAIVRNIILTGKFLFLGLISFLSFFIIFVIVYLYFDCHGFTFLTSIP